MACLNNNVEIFLWFSLILPGKCQDNSAHPSQFEFANDSIIESSDAI
jgi:hypothetical protein